MIDITEKQFEDLINKLKVHLKTIKDFIPVADMEQIYIVDDVIKLLEGKKDPKPVFNRVSKYFLDAVGYAHNQIDEQKLEQIVLAIVDAAEKQKQQSPQEILKEMRNYHKLVVAQRNEINDASVLIWHLLGIQKNVSSDAGYERGIIARKRRRDKFKKAAKTLDNIINRVPMDKLISISPALFEKIISGSFTEKDYEQLLIDFLKQKEI